MREDLTPSFEECHTCKGKSPNHIARWENWAFIKGGPTIFTRKRSETSKASTLE